MRFDEASARYGEFGPFWAGLQFSPGELSVFLDGDAIPQFDVPENKVFLLYFDESLTVMPFISGPAPVTLFQAVPPAGYFQKPNVFAVVVRRY